jgi:predicted HTH transcriptional regulator
MADFLDQTRSDIDRRLKELRPLHEEYLKLEQAKNALEGLEAPRRSPGRPRGAGSSPSSNGRRRRRRRQGGTRGEQALELVRQNPGITVNDLSEQLNVKHKNYLYRVMADLQNDGAVKKEGRGYVAA